MRKSKKASNRIVWSLPRVLLLLLAIVLSWPHQARAELVEKLQEFPATMHCEDLEISTLLRAIGLQTGVNIFVADNVTGTISFEVDNLTLYDVFQLIIDTNGLHYIEKNNIISVKNRDDVTEGMRNLTTEKICVDFGKAGEHIDQLKHLLSADGTMTTINRDNCLLVRDQADIVELIREMVDELDRPIPQIHIEARIVAITDTGKKQLGVKWDYQNYRDDDLLATKNKPVIINSDLSVSSPTTTFVTGFIWDNMNLNVELQALEAEDELEILSAPSLLVLDGKEAEIKQGKEVPYVAQSGDNLNTSFREANLSLKVTPKIMRNKMVMLAVTVTNDQVDETTSSGSDPLIERQEIRTDLYLEDRVTVVIGGIKGNRFLEDTSGIPILKDIPGLGRLFKSTDKLEGSYELLIFLTPTVVSIDMTRMHGKQADDYIRQRITEPTLTNFSSSHPQIPGRQEQETADRIHENKMKN